MDERSGEIKALLAEWAELWGDPSLSDGVRVEFSTRMRRAIGRCSPGRRLIRLNSQLLLDEHRALLREALCHEFAHLAAYQLYGEGLRPHGEEWAGLQRRAGFDPEKKFSLPSQEATRRSPGKLRYSHRCPVCQTVYTARRPVSYWRCARCLDAGLDGRLIITAAPTQPPQDV